MSIKSNFLKKIEKFLAENNIKECLSYEKLVDLFPDFSDFLALERERISKMAEFDLSLQELMKQVEDHLQDQFVGLV